MNLTSTLRGLFSLTLGTSLLLFAGCADDIDEPEADSTGGVTLSDVDDSEPGDSQTADDSGLDPSQMLGKTVTVRGEVEKVYDSHSVELDDDWDDSILVVTREPLPAALTPGGENLDDVVVEVTGVVAEFNLVEMERETGWDMQPEIEAELEETERMLISASARIVGSDD